jgi:hypothetical protein
VTSEILTPAVMEWAGRAAPGARVARCLVRPLAGGAVARQVDQVTLHLTGHHEPELVAWGGDWLITPLARGSPLAWGDAVPANLVDALAALHAASTAPPACLRRYRA